jgi:hypothetical protein
LTDEVIRNLAVIEGLQVRSRTSSFAFKEKARICGRWARSLAPRSSWRDRCWARGPAVPEGARIAGPAGNPQC